MSASGALRMTFAQRNIAALDHQPFAGYKTIRQLAAGSVVDQLHRCAGHAHLRSSLLLLQIFQIHRRMASYSSSVICTHSVVLSCGENSLNVGRPQILRHFLGLGMNYS